jgi:hypothetical protein
MRVPEAAKPLSWRQRYPFLYGIGRKLLCVAVVAVLTLIGVYAFRETIIGNIFRNVVDISDGEMPNGVASFPSGPEIVSIIGGSGAGLNCSLPNIVGDMLFDADVDERIPENKRDRIRLVRQKFRQACVFHDLCYRHGLATYGYSQNECDRILQDQAHRLCHYLSSSPKYVDDCQYQTKMVLAGVAVGGFGSYRAWDRSTFFEFDTNPLKSIEFRASRVVDHPFKSLLPEKYKGDPDHIILSFSLRRNSIRAVCENCLPNRMLEPARDPKDPDYLSAEFRSAGHKKRPEALIDHSASIEQPRTVWLPPDHHHAAPQFVQGTDGKHHLVWMSRPGVTTTGSCMVLTDVRAILTYTLPATHGCWHDANPVLSPVQVEMLSSAPLPMIAASGKGQADAVVAIGLTVQRTGNLDVCGWSKARLDLKKGNPRMAACRMLAETTQPNDGIAVPERNYRIGAFQNFPIVRQNQAIFFERDVWTRPAGSGVWSSFRRRFSRDGRAWVLDVDSNPDWTGNAAPIRAKRAIPFNIDDTFDPMMPLSSDPDDVNFISIRSDDKRERASIHLINFENDHPAPQDITVTVVGSPVDLHNSWLHRPVHIVQPKGTGRKSAQIILSRGANRALTTTGPDEARIEFAVLEREAETNDLHWSVRRAASCGVTYAFKPVDPRRACHRPYVSGRVMRESPAAMIQGAQLLMGRFGERNEMSLALIDECFEGEPIIFSPAPATSKSMTTFVPAKPTGPPRNNVSRTVSCGPLTDLGSFQEAINMDRKQ